MRSSDQLLVCANSAKGVDITVGGSTVAGADGVLGARMEAAGTTTVVLAGRMPDGATGGELVAGAGSTTGLGVEGSWWVTDRLSSATSLAGRPRTAQLVMRDDRGEQVQRWQVTWPGAAVGGRLAGDVLQAACSQEQLTQGARVTSSWRTKAGHGTVLQVAGQGLLACSGISVAGSEQVAFGVPAASDEVATLPPDGDSGAAGVLGGVLPAGATGVQVVGPAGSQQATVSGGHWVWEDPLEVTQLGLEPQYLLVRFTGRTNTQTWVPWVDSSAVASATEVADGVPQLWTGDRLVTECRKGAPDGAVGAHSFQGHVVLLGGQACAGGNGFTYRWDAHRTTTVDGAAFTVQPSWSDKGPGLWFGGGTLPSSSITAITFNTPSGGIPARISKGQWVYEQQMAVFDKAQAPTSVTVTEGGTTRTYQLPAT